MNSSYSLYRLLTTSSSLLAVPLIWLHHRFRGDNFYRFYHRIGRYPESLATVNNGHPRIWIHAVSVGEVGVASAIYKTLRPKFPRGTFFLSTLREQGLARAKAEFGDTVSCFFAPLDLIGPTRRALRMVRPDALVLLETEIWPNLIVGAHRMGVRTAIVNGRISVRSIRRYRKVHPLMKYTLAHIDAFSMISMTDSQRIQSIGAAEDRISVNGNAKFDVPDPLKEGQNKLQWGADLYGIDAQTKTLVAGSTRNPEEMVILDAFARIRQSFPHALLIIAPRHIERAAQVRQWVRNAGLECQLRTQLDGRPQCRHAPVVILDTMGELSDTYGIADLVFCGGSLVPKGGQNIMEPAMWSKPVMYGPSMEDFEDAKMMIQTQGGGALIHDAAEMADVALQWLAFPQKAQAVGLAARQSILPHGGAAEKHAQVIYRMLNGHSLGSVFERPLPGGCQDRRP